MKLAKWMLIRCYQYDYSFGLCELVYINGIMSERYLEEQIKTIFFSVYFCSSLRIVLSTNIWKMATTIATVTQFSCSTRYFRIYPPKVLLICGKLIRCLTRKRSHLAHWIGNLYKFSKAKIKPTTTRTMFQIERKKVCVAYTELEAKNQKKQMN